MGGGDDRLLIADLGACGDLASGQFSVVLGAAATLAAVAALGRCRRFGGPTLAGICLSAYLEQFSGQCTAKK